MEAVSWTSMSEGSAEDYRILADLYETHATQSLVPNLAGMLRMLEGPKLGYQIDRYQHSLQSASRAIRNDESVDLVVCALLHDIGDGFAPDNHSVAAAAIVEPFVDEENHWVVKHHGLFQGYYYFHHLGGDRDTRERYRSAPHFDACARFCELYDQNCFDPDYPNLTFDDFLPSLNEVFSRPARHSDYTDPSGSDRIGNPEV